MNNINTIDKNNNPKKLNSWRNLGYALMLAGLLNIHTPTYANSHSYKNISTEQVKSDSNSINGIKLPPIYQNKIDDFLANNNVMKDSGTKKFTINFVEKEMEADWGISKENQLLFIRHSIYKQITEQDLYDGKDGDQKIAEDFSNKVINVRIRACGQKYRSGFTAYMQQRANDAQQRANDAQQRANDAKEEALRLDSTGIKQLINYYDLCQSNPNAIKKDELDETKTFARRTIQRCKTHGINYRAVLLKEVGDRKKVEEILKFYDVE